MGQANEAIQKIHEQIDAIAQQRKSIRQENQPRRSGDLSVDSLLSTGRYDMQLEGETHSLTQTLAQLAEELQRRQSSLVSEEAEVKRFERLEEKDRLQHDAELQRREQAEADDATARRYTIERQRHSHDFKTA